MKRLTTDNQFKDSKMSFGDHLEELRSALWKAVIALFLGFLVGLLIGNEVVKFVQAPLNEGLTELRLKQKQRKYEASLAPGVEPNNSALEQGIAPEKYTIDSAEMIALLEQLGADVAEPTEGLPEQVPLTLWRSLEDGPGVRAVATAVTDPFTVYIKASLVVGVILSSPAIFYFMWTFVAAGLYPHERRYVHIFLPFSIGLFLLGAGVAFFFAIKFVLSFLFGFYDWMDIDPVLRIDQWLSFALILPLGFGVAFQLPLVMLFLDRIGVMTPEAYLKYWRYAILIIFILSMFLTPQDPQSMILLALPLTILYFGGILLCKYMPRRTAALSTPDD